LNVLILCAGRRAYLVNYFREVIEPLGGIVVTANSEPIAAGFLAGDRRYVVPRINSPAYIPTLLQITQKEQIGLVLSLFDIDLPALSKARERFHDLGAELAISDPEVIEVACDKWRMFNFLSSRGLPTPLTWIDPEAVIIERAAGIVDFPLIVKPRWGMGSIGVVKTHSISQLRRVVAEVSDLVRQGDLAMMSSENQRVVLIQEFLNGPEYNADVFNDFGGNHLATAIKRNIATRAGEIDAAITVDDSELETLCIKISSILRHRGNLDVDLVRPDGQPAHILDLNARFGGGYPFSHLAGARFPRALVQMVRGEIPDPGRALPGIMSLKDILPRAFDPIKGFVDPGPT
jgi:carbamoyl-phosphate synthase large subunit